MLTPEISLKTTLQRICKLQPLYSSSNTEPMQERGQLIRGDLTEALRLILPSIQPAFGSQFSDLGVEGSDGIGRKTEAPWVRLFSKAMSPNPREGFYIVIHFAANGDALFITVGCGSTIWSGGDLRAISDHELEKRTSWARKIVQQNWGSISPFSDEIKIGAKAALPATFEKATAFAKRIGYESIESTNFGELLYKAAERLAEIYKAQLNDRDISIGDEAAEVINSISRPLGVRGRRQGFGLNAKERRAIEVQAMSIATEWLNGEGFICKDCSARESFDILATRENAVIKVEVKGTTSDICDSVMMTKNEVELHRQEKGSTALILVSQITLDRKDQEPQAFGGVLEVLWGWDIDEWLTEPLAFQVTRKH
jgi:hypothetical protein